MFSVASRFRRRHSLAESLFFSNRRNFFSLNGSPFLLTRGWDDDSVWVFKGRFLAASVADGDVEASVGVIPEDDNVGGDDDDCCCCCCCPDEDEA
jgi:hypothetical protein